MIREVAKGGWWKALLIAVVAVVLFIPATRGDFTGWDDTAYVINNPLVRDPAGLPRIWLSADSEQYYPLTFSAYWLQFRLWGENPTGYLWVSVLLHGLNAALVFLVTRRLFGDVVSVLVALLFAAHPMQAMSVGWIAQQKNVISTGFVLLAVMAWLERLREGVTHTRRWRLYAAAAVCFALALLSKTQVLGLPLVLALIDWRMGERRLGRVCAAATPLLVLSALAASLTIAFEQRFLDPAVSGYMPGVLERLQIAGASPWWYASKLAAPVGLSPVYEMWGVGAGGMARVLWWLPLIATAAVVVIVFWGRTPARVAVGLGLFGVVLAPTSGVVAYANLAASPVSDHFVYLASVGLWWAAAAGVEAWMPRAAQRSAIVAVMVGVVVYSAMAIAYTPTFRDGTRMWGRAVEIAPGNYSARLGLAESLRAEGKFEEARRNLDRAIEIRPDWPDGYLFRAMLEMDRGNPAAAVAAAERVLDLSSEQRDAEVLLGRALIAAGRAAEAAAPLERAVAAEPGDIAVRMQLAELYLGLLQRGEAAEQFEAVVEIEPRVARAWLGLATARRGMGEYAAAAEAAERGLAVNGDDVALLNMVALVRATAPVAEVRDGARAVEAASRAAVLTNGENPLVLDTLAAAFAEAGRVADAVGAGSAAATLHRRMGNEVAAAESERRVGMFERGEKLRLSVAGRE